MRRQHTRSSRIGIFLIILGVLLLLDQLDILDFQDVIQTFWPLLLILLGLRLILSPGRPREPVQSHPREVRKAAVAEGEPVLRRHTEAQTFGEIRYVFGKEAFEGANFSVTFGDIDINAEHIHLAPGQQTLFLNTVFGDIRLRLPQDIPCLIRASSTAGEIYIGTVHSSGLFIHRTVKRHDFDRATTRLVVVTKVVFGDIHIW